MLPLRQRRDVLAGTPDPHLVLYLTRAGVTAMAVARWHFPPLGDFSRNRGHSLCLDHRPVVVAAARRLGLATRRGEFQVWAASEVEREADDVIAMGRRSEFEGRVARWPGQPPEEPPPRPTEVPPSPPEMPNPTPELPLTPAEFPGTPPEAPPARDQRQSDEAPWSSKSRVGKSGSTRRGATSFKRPAGRWRGQP